MIEYAVTAGEGTLIDYGVCSRVERDSNGDYIISRDDWVARDMENNDYRVMKTFLIAWCPLVEPSRIVIQAPCGEDCLTGK